MKKSLFIICFVAFMGCFISTDAAPRGGRVRSRSRANARARAEVLERNSGYYKDVFMDGGILLTSRRTLPAADFLNLQWEFFASAKNKKTLTKVDTLLQTSIFCGSEEDTNGWLLYPDGAPRYRMIYVNGGRAASHGRSMTPEGKAQMRRYVAAGGGYVGTCAGAYLASSGSGRKKRYSKEYYGLWPHSVYGTGLNRSKTDMTIERKSPLLRYYNFGRDKYIAEVRHNGGCFAKDEDFQTIPGVIEPLTRYVFENTKRVKIDGKISTWAYKKDAETGRVISCGSHPEGVEEGERLEFMSAMMLYAMDGNPAPKVKGELKTGEVREMNKRTEDNNPDYTRIGDKQYHHFVVDVPKKCAKVVVSLEGYEGENNFDLLLCANSEAFAFEKNATCKSAAEGTNKQLTIEKPKEGKWYVSVHCKTTVSSKTGKYGTEYSGRTDVLNGVPYKISVKVE